MSVKIQNRENIQPFVDNLDAAISVLTCNAELQKAAVAVASQIDEGLYQSLKRRLCLSNSKTEEELFEEGRNSLAIKQAKQLQKKMEISYATIKYRELEIQKLADTSKMRHRIRLKAAQEKKKLLTHLIDYNILAPTVTPPLSTVSAEEATQGFFPWIIIGDVDSIPTCQKRKIVDHRMLLERSKEEIDLVISEMSNYLATQQKELKLLEQKMRMIYHMLKDNNIEDFKGVFPLCCDPLRYSFTESPSKKTIEGCFALCERWHCEKVVFTRECCSRFQQILQDTPDIDFLSDLDIESEESEDVEGLEDEDDVDESDILKNLDDYFLEEVDDDFL